MNWTPQKQIELIIDSLIARAEKGDQTGLNFAKAVKNENKIIMHQILDNEIDQLVKRTKQRFKATKK